MIVVMMHVHATMNVLVMMSVHAMQMSVHAMQMNVLDMQMSVLDMQMSALVMQMNAPVMMNEMLHHVVIVVAVAIVIVRHYHHNNNYRHNKFMKRQEVSVEGGWIQNHLVTIAVVTFSTINIFTFFLLIFKLSYHALSLSLSL